MRHNPTLHCPCLCCHYTIQHYTVHVYVVITYSNITLSMFMMSLHNPTLCCPCLCCHYTIQHYTVRVYVVIQFCDRCVFLSATITVLNLSKICLWNQVLIECNYEQSSPFKSYCVPTIIYQHLHQCINSDIHDTDDKRSSI